MTALTAKPIYKRLKMGKICQGDWKIEQLPISKRFTPRVKFNLATCREVLR
jgi:hypothetical protein